MRFCSNRVRRPAAVSVLVVTEKTTALAFETTRFKSSMIASQQESQSYLNEEYDRDKLGKFIYLSR